MALNGLDADPVVAAHDATAAEANGWFLLHYVSRDAVELLSSGTDGVAEARDAIAKYEEESPLFGLVVSKKRKTLLKYVPEGTSRLLQVRLAVHLQSVLEKFPHDALLSLTSASELTEAALSTSLNQLKSSNPNRAPHPRVQRPLTEIAEDSDEASQRLSHRDGLERSQVDALELTLESPPDPLLSPASQPLSSARLETDHAAFVSDADSTPATSPPLDIPTLKHFDSAFPADEPGEPRDASAERPTGQLSRAITYEPDFSWSYKPKVKVGPRPSLDQDTRARASGTFARPVATLPAGIRVAAKGPREPDRPKTQQSNSKTFDSGMPRYAAFAPGFPRPKSRAGSVASVPGYISSAAPPSPVTSLTPSISLEKQRLMKALEKRKQNQAKKLEAEAAKKAQEAGAQEAGAQEAGAKAQAEKTDEPSEPVPFENNIATTEVKDFGKPSATVSAGYESPASDTIPTPRGASFADSEQESTIKDKGGDNRSSPELPSLSANGANDNSNGTENRSQLVDGDRAATHAPSVDEQKPTAHKIDLPRDSSPTLADISSGSLSPDADSEDTQARSTEASAEESSDEVTRGSAGILNVSAHSEHTSHNQSIEAGVYLADSGSSSSTEVDKESKEASAAGSSKAPIATPFSPESERSHLPGVESSPIVQPDSISPASNENHLQNMKEEMLEAKEDLPEDLLLASNLDTQLDHLPTTNNEVSPREVIVGGLGDQRSSDKEVANNAGATPSLSQFPHQTSSTETSAAPAAGLVDTHEAHHRPTDSTSTVKGPTVVTQNLDNYSGAKHSVNEDLQASDDAPLDPKRSSAASKASKESAKKRPPPLASKHDSSDIASLDGDSLYEELRSATVQEARSILVSHSPATPVFQDTTRPESRRGSDNLLLTRAATSPPPSLPTEAFRPKLVQTATPPSLPVNVHSDAAQNDATTTPEFGKLRKVRSTSSSNATTNGTLPNGNSSPRKGSGVSSLISQRIKAFETAKNGGGGSAADRTAVITPSIVSQRKASLTTPPGSSGADSLNGSRNGSRSYPTPSPSPQNGFVARTFGSVRVSSNHAQHHANSLHRQSSRESTNNNPSTSSSRLSSVNTSPNEVQKPTTSYFSVPAPTKKNDRSFSKDWVRPAEKPVSKGRRSSTSSSTPENKRSSRASISSRRSTISQASGDTARPMSSGSPRSESSFSSDGNGVGEKGEKKGSRSSRLLRRMSSIALSPRRNIAQALGGSFSEQAIEETGEPPVHKKWKAVEVGDVNVQFPDTLLWKRRNLSIDALGNLVLRPATTDKASKIAPKQYYVAQFREPYIPDQDREEMPHSVILDFQDGTTLQCSCADRPAQIQVLQVLRNAHMTFSA